MKTHTSVRSALYVMLAAFMLQSGCTKEDVVSGNGDTTRPAPTTYTTYLIRQGQHYCDQSTVRSVTTSEMKFMVIFDSTAIYQTVNAVNQYDINKLYGFSEGINNQYNSARIGWRWSDGALRLFGYVYKQGTRYSQEITTIPLKTEISCSIKLSGSNYLITAKGVSVTLPRGLSTTTASGYQQYPYFGGDEVAPQNIYIKIKNI